MTKPANLVEVYDKLSTNQRAVLCRVINLAKEANGDNGWMHLGILPFVTRDEAIRSMRGAVDRIWGSDLKSERILREILAILRDPTFVSDIGHFMMRLNDKKVYRQFGKNPERGKPMTCLPKEKVTVGFTNRFGKLKPDTEVLVHPAVRLEKTGPGFWLVEVKSRHKKAVQEWLHANCG